MAEGSSSVPPIDFTTFVLSLSTNGMIQLGEVEGPEGAGVDFALAKQTLEMLEMLEAKTSGNLTGEEERILTQVLSDYRDAYEKRAR
jgi:hypothetical protein